MKIVSLFSGAGGLDVSATLAGGKVICCIDNDADSIQTLKLNSCTRKAVHILADVSQLSGKDIRAASGIRAREKFFMIGGPPCQSFSKNNYWTKSGKESLRRKLVRKAKTNAEGNDYLSSVVLPKKKSRIEVHEDSRTSLLMEYARLIREMRPEGFLFENVASIRHPSNGIYLDEFKEACEAEGFNMAEFLLQSECFGVAQKRRRVFVVGHRGGVPETPTETNSLEPSLFLKPAVTAREAIDKFQDERFFEPEEVIAGRWADCLKEIPPGMNYKAITSWAGHPKPLFEAETRFWNFLLKLHPDRPSWTIASSPGPWIGPFHWLNRRLRTPELAAIQSFPDGYLFYGSRRSRVRQIGNAVPPQLGRRVMEKLFSV